MKFSQRIGQVPETKSIQLESIDDDLKNGLWNLSKMLIIDNISKHVDYGGSTDFDSFCQQVWHHYFKLPIDTIPAGTYNMENFIRQRYFSFQWYEVYDFVEFLSFLKFEKININRYIEAVNNLLQVEFSAYRFINGRLAPISNKLEAEEIKEALSNTYKFTALKGANIHLNVSLEKLSQKKNPDYRNSIKEAISAVETACRVLTNESTLGKALKKLEKNGVQIDSQLNSGFEKIYAYTNSATSGIRHAIIEDHKAPDFHDAKYMLISCSAFINFLIGKCQIQESS